MMATNPFNGGEFYTTDELRRMGFRHVGDGAKIARNCTLVGLPNISIGKHSRVDAYSMVIAIDQQVDIGRNVHVASYVLLSGRGGLVLEDFVGVSHGSKIYTANDDYGGDYLTGPTVPAKYLGMTIAAVRLGRHAIVGAGCIVLPGVEIGEGASIGALSLVSRSIEPWTVNVGVPAKAIRSRSRRLLDLERSYLAEDP